MSPTLGRSVCLAQLDAAHAAAGTAVTVRLPDGRRISARVTEHLAHVDPAGQRLRAGTDAPVGPARDAGTPVARSPISARPAPAGTGALTITDLSAVAKVQVRAPHDGAVAAALVPFGRAARDGSGALVIGSGPGEWLVIDAPGTQEALLARLEDHAAVPDEFVTLVDLSHGRALVRLCGRRSADLLAKVCGIDLADDVVPDGAALRTSVAKLVTDIVRDDAGGVPGYLLHCERSSGQYLVDALLDAGAEFGIALAAELPSWR
jgi:sarcosine oxidase subunit alpha